MFFTSPTSRAARSTIRRASRMPGIRFTEFWRPKMKPTNESLSPSLIVPARWRSRRGWRRTPSKLTAAIWPTQRLSFGKRFEWTRGGTASFTFLCRLSAPPGARQRSIARHLVTLRRLYRFLQTEELLSDNPLPGALYRGAAKVAPDVIRRRHSKAHHPAGPDEPLGARDRAMLELLYAPACGSPN